MFFKITMFRFVLNTILMISAVSQVRGLNKNISNTSNNFHHTKNEPSFLILKDIHGNMYKYIYPNDMDQFSKMSTLGNKNSSTVIHLPPGILKTENSPSKIVISRVDNPKKTSERPQILIQKSTIIDHAPTHSLLGNDKGDEKEKRKTIVEDILPTTERRNSNENHTTVFKNEIESTETTTIENSKNEHEAQTDDDDDDDGKDNNKNDPILKSAPNPRIFSSKKGSENHENEQQNVYKSSDIRNNLILLVKNDIKLKLFINSNGILNKSSPANSRKNPTVQLNDELSTEDDTTINDSPTPIVDVE
ncbi:sphingosine kinase B-like [Rhopalosiphum maidis]|uniref:sphingosine kinase B-like n=1 Tax=Rhopalosiphum maidis TaxID=43146 RepID=UPI000F002DE6|nr:sphingosine kinase B-like [Rhopalosiphum maidis]